MAASKKQKPRAIQVTLGDGRELTLREPEASEYLRVMSAQVAVVKFHQGDELTDTDEAHVRRTIALLAVTDGWPVDDEGNARSFTEADILALSAPDWARLFVGLMQVLKVANDESPLAKPKNSASSLTEPTSVADSPSGPTS